MIFDRIDNLTSYLGYSARVDQVICWLQKNDLRQFPDGETELDGKNILVRVATINTRGQENARFEVHHKYIDLQIALEGCESFCVGEGASDSGFDTETDTGLCDGVTQGFGVLSAGWFVVFGTRELHMPALHGPQGPGQVRRAVFKILRDDLAER